VPGTEDGEPMTTSRTFRTALITGISGSGGSYLAEYILEHHPGVAVHGLARWHTTANAANLAAVRDRVTVHECDLLDLGSILRVLTGVRPDVIFHLAAHANVRVGFDTPIAVYNNNVMGTMNLLEAIRLSGTDPLMQMCSTSEVYGQVTPDLVPITENCPISPANPYAASKAAQDLLCGAYWQSFGLRVVRTRMFTYVNPRRADLFATAFARQVARIEAGQQRELLHGNLQSTRTMIDVRDAMSAYWGAATGGEVGAVYNIGGATTMTVGEVLDYLKAQATVDIPSRVDPALMRPVDVTLQIPDCEKFRAATGWTVVHSFEESVAHLLAHCRQAVASDMRSNPLDADRASTGAH
jgi:GDP-4-dehydro-6-deoxy-D-mannose reductase